MMLEKEQHKEGFGDFIIQGVEGMGDIMKGDSEGRPKWQDAELLCSIFQKPDRKLSGKLGLAKVRKYTVLMATQHCECNRCY